MSIFKRKDVVSREQADDQIEMLCEYYDVDLDFIVEDLQVALKNHLLGLTKAIVRGRLSIDEHEGDLRVVQFLKNGTEIKYKPVDASVTVAAERFKDPVDRVRGLMAAACSGQLAIADMKELPPEDQAVIDDLGNYFLFL